MRSAVGASRTRILRQLLTESVLLSLIGGAAGLLLAAWLRPFGDIVLPAPEVHSTVINGTVAGWALASAAVCGIAFGFLPAWRAANKSINAVQSGSILTHVGGSRRAWFSQILVTFQVALATVLLIGGSLLLRSVMRLLASDVGIQPKGVVEITSLFSIRHYRTPEQMAAVTHEFAKRLTELPGTQSVGFVGGGGMNYYLEDSTRPLSATSRTVSVGKTDYLKTLGVSLREGRWLEASDDGPGSRAVLVNETFARSSWPGESPLGKRIYTGSAASQYSEGDFSFSEVVGVIENFKTSFMEVEPFPVIFVPFGRQPGQIGFNYFVRTSLNPVAFAERVRQMSKEVVIDPPEPEMSWLEDQLYASTAGRRMLTWLLASLGGTGLCLAMLGVFGMLLHSVVRRTKEMGIRIALGAINRDVVIMILRQGMTLVVAGTLLGLAASMMLVRLIRGLLYDIAPDDPLTFILVPLGLTAVALIACYLPARRATKVDPIIALRAE